MSRPSSPWNLSALKWSPFANRLRQELGARNREYAARYGLTMRESYGTQPVFCYMPFEDGECHGNFMSESYRAIGENAGWARRLEKVHTQGRHSLPQEDRMAGVGLLQQLGCFVDEHLLFPWNFERIASF